MVRRDASSPRITPASQGVQLDLYHSGVLGNVHLASSRFLPLHTQTLFHKLLSLWVGFHPLVICDPGMLSSPEQSLHFAT